VSGKIRAALAALEAIDPMSFGEPIVGKTYKADGWVYRDIGGTTTALWGELMTILGEDNVVVLAASTNRDNTIIRGQILVSPDGVKRANEFAKSRAN
jgi:hypothetical protein